MMCYILLTISTSKTQNLLQYFTSEMTESLTVYSISRTSSVEVWKPCYWLMIDRYYWYRSVLLTINNQLESV